MKTISLRWQQIDINKIPENFVFVKEDIIYKLTNGMFFCDGSNERLKPFFI